jgi:hypothetical protein
MSLATTIRRTVWEIDKDQPVSDISSMEEIVSQSVARQRFQHVIARHLCRSGAPSGGGGYLRSVIRWRNALAKSGFASRSARRKGDVLKITVGEGLRLVLTGVVIGLAAALILTRVMSSLLFGVSANDPITFITISLILVSVAVLASYVLALRATRVDPMFALRYQ